MADHLEIAAAHLHTAALKRSTGDRKGMDDYLRLADTAARLAAIERNLPPCCSHSAPEQETP
jgi:hypothetical protein